MVDLVELSVLRLNAFRRNRQIIEMPNRLALLHQ
jgi:hypothetical protein